MRSRVVKGPSRAPCAALASGCYAPVCRQRGVPRRRTQHRSGPSRIEAQRAGVQTAMTLTRRPAAFASLSISRRSLVTIESPRNAPTTTPASIASAVGVWRRSGARRCMAHIRRLSPRPRRVRRRRSSDHSPARATRRRRLLLRGGLLVLRRHVGGPQVDDTGGVEGAVRLVQFIVGERPVLRLVRRDRCKSTLAAQVQRASASFHQRRHRPATDFPLRALEGALMPMLA